ncbi:4-hydroxy-tetrahydrodipicolinate reductase [Pseudoflavonifractor sp. MSJ-37]|uniref:4-hydroxy-tetrahydrodipicolinate reductase n=1 Tax=Pseudoflavonifractor sp. MSJ-37 TaxID=2841531 RepID=UPI001C1193F9|nr:4-hydroxy-tetrahydrodipicolinate reductase [Pseudoflavonifractor sp. MSJ-37]MBU5435297.1 4-hydroxy-tetrahydrodipicolinate reductase [Pseudoflavonifractor sp. MSJ-37]
MSALDLVLVGTGRMGLAVRHVAEARGDVTISAAFHRSNVWDLEVLEGGAGAVIDFSSPESLPHIAAYVRRTGTPLICGTTGLDERQTDLLRQLGERAPVLYSANFSVGVAVLRRLAAQAAAALGGDFDIEIVEAHHNKKADAPSGTAKLLLSAVDPDHDHRPVYGREGNCGRRDPREIGVHAIRGGTVAGMHTVSFYGPQEELHLTHRADSREIFAAGAVKAASLLAGKTPGYYALEDLLFPQAN